MTIQINSLTELLKIFSADSTVQGFEEGVIVKNADGSGEVIMLNDNFPVPDMAETNRNQPTPRDGTTLQEATDATDSPGANKLWLVPRKSV
mgnify:CR=1 FL=1|jgi:hypothetical protein